MLCNEGTYPFHSGGVSTWCHALIEKMSDVNFHILAVESTPWVALSYDLPENVDNVQLVPQWNGDLHKAVAQGSRGYYESWFRTTDRSIRKQILPHMESLFTALFNDEKDSLAFTRAIGWLHRYWIEHDYRRTFRSGVVWKAYCDAVKSSSWPVEPSDYELSFGLSLIQNLFSSLAVRLPRVDVTHSSAAAFCALPAIALKERFGIPMVLSEHGVYLRERLLALNHTASSNFISHLMARMVKTLVRACYSAADRILPVCKFNSKWEQHMGAEEEKISTVYNGVDSQLFKPILESVINEFEAYRPTVISLARIDPLKDIETLLRVADNTRKYINDVQFKLFGDIWDSEYHKDCVKLHKSLSLSNNFMFAGPTSSPSAAYQQGDIVALSSISEAFPYTVIEAMMSGKPVVATDVGGVSEAIGDCGFTVEPRNPEKMAEACVKLLNDKTTRENLGIKALARARSAFDIDDMALMYEHVYREAMAGPHCIAEA